RCWASRRIDPTADYLSGRCFAGTRFRCRRCDTPGQLEIRLAELMPVGGSMTLAFLWRKQCLPVTTSASAATILQSNTSKGQLVETVGDWMIASHRYRLKTVGSRPPDR